MPVLVNILLACHVAWGAPGLDTTIKPKCMVVDAGSIPAASTPPRVSRDRTPAAAKNLTVRIATRYGFHGAQLRCLINLWHRESRFNPNAHNRRSGAGGIPQILGMSPKTATSVQIQRGLEYITHRYGSPCQALRHHDRHGWY